MSRLFLLKRMDWIIITVIFLLMLVSLTVISSYTVQGENDEAFFTPLVRVQLKWFGIGSIVFLCVASFDYNKLREWTWFLYALMLFTLIGLFFTESVQRVHRWYKVPFLNMSIQPSEYAKLIVAITLSWFMERRSEEPNSMKTLWGALIIVGIPFLLILKQPDLGTAMIFFPMTLVMFYFGNIHPWVTKTMIFIGTALLLTVAIIFLGVLNPESIRPYANKVMKEYQFDRLNPKTHQLQASTIAIAIGGLMGVGWRKSTYAAEGWLPTPYTDSVFPAFAEEFGFFGILFLLGIFYILIYRGFLVIRVAKDQFGRLLAAGITTYLSMHALINIGMMSGFLPITGVPLILVSYGGSSILLTMTALGILQSIYIRRFMF